MKNINQILEKYFAGETSIKEERQLRQYFNQTNIAEEFRPYQPLFQLQTVEQEVAIPDFDFSFMDEKADNQSLQSIQKVRSVNYYLLRIAAMLAIGIGIWWSFQPKETLSANNPQAINWEQYEVEDPEQALAEAKAALKLLSKKIGKR